MKIKLEISLIALGGIIRIVDIATDLWYFLVQQFDSDLLYYIFLATLAAPSAVLFLIYLFLIVSDFCKNSSFSSFKLFMFLLFILGDSIGLNYFVFAFVMCLSQVSKADYYIIDAMFRASSLINSLFQSIPQIVLQVYNNLMINSWPTFNIICIGVSVLSMIYSCVKLVYAVDKMKQNENGYIENSTIPRNSSKIVQSDFDEVKLETEKNVENEVYEDSNN
jgi:hypothetical protein